MKRELITTTLLVTLTHEKPIPNITDFVANRLSTIEGMDSSGLTVGIVRPDIQTHLAGEEHPAEAFERMMKHLFSPVLMVSVTEEGKRQLAELLKQPQMHGVLQADTDSITTGHNMLMDVVKEHLPLLKTWTPKPGEHVLYTDEDVDRPDVICDSNGQVTLDLCKVCGLAEAELLDTPVCPGHRRNSIKDDNGQVVLASRDPLDDL